VYFRHQYADSDMLTEDAYYTPHGNGYSIPGKHGARDSVVHE